MDILKFSIDDSQFRVLGSDHPSRHPSRDDNPPLSLPKHEKGERFVKGPIPLKWLAQANGCGARANGVSILLWYAAGLQRTNPVKLTPSILTELRIDPKTARRVLRKMQELSLVKVEFHRGESPLVTLLSFQEES